MSSDFFNRVGDRISTAIAENCEVGITVNGSSNVCFSSPLKTLFLRGTMGGILKIWIEIMKTAMREPAK